MDIFFKVLTFIYLLLSILALYVVMTKIKRQNLDIQKMTEEDKQKYRMFIRRDQNKQNKIHLIICAIFLFPFRFLAIVILMILEYTILFIILHAIKNPNSRLRFLICQYVTILISRGILLFSGFYYIREKRIQFGKNQKLVAPIVISNHCTFIDIFILISKFGCTFIAKKIISNYPIIGTIGAELQVLYVDRKDRNQKNQILDLITEKVQTFNSKQKFPLAIFPEGTTSNGAYFLDFKKGSFYNFSPIQIVILKYGSQNFNHFLDSYGTLFCFISTLCQLRNDLEVIKFDVVTPEDFGITNKNEENWEEYANKVKDLIQKNTGIQFTNFGYLESCELQNVISDIWKQDGYNEKKHN